MKKVFAILATAIMFASCTKENTPTDDPTDTPSDKPSDKPSDDPSADTYTVVIRYFNNAIFYDTYDCDYDGKDITLYHDQSMHILVKDSNGEFLPRAKYSLTVDPNNFAAADIGVYQSTEGLCYVAFNSHEAGTYRFNFKCQTVGSFVSKPKTVVDLNFTIKSLEEDVPFTMAEDYFAEGYSFKMTRNGESTLSDAPNEITIPIGDEIEIYAVDPDGNILPGDGHYYPTKREDLGFVSLCPLSDSKGNLSLWARGQNVGTERAIYCFAEGGPAHEILCRRLFTFTVVEK